MEQILKVSEETRSLCECEALFDIAFEAGVLTAQGILNLDDTDSRDMFWQAMRWTEEFEEQFDDSGDYLTEIILFAHRKLTDTYGAQRNL